MTRSVSATITAAVAEKTTRPIYLVRMAWATETRSATWASDITWNAETWSASGVEINSLSATGGRMTLPMGSADPWLALVRGEIPRDRAIEVYEYQTDFTSSPIASDAQLIFEGVMDDAVITERGIQVSLVESKTHKAFPQTSVQPPTYNYLLIPGSRIFWRNDVITVN